MSIQYDKNKKKYLIIADDFTGANDTAVQIKKRGYPVKLIFSSSLKIKEKFVVIDTETRTLSAQKAYEYIKNITENLLKKQDFNFIYKKVDSTLRGNIIEEIKAINEIYHPEVIIFAPAFPKLERTTQNGVHKVKGIPILQTEFAKDPINPVQTDNIIEMLKKGFQEDVTYISLKTLYSLDNIKYDKGKYYTFDVETIEDIQKIAKLGLESNRKVLWIGSAGLIEGIFDILYPKKPSLGIVGSVSEVSSKQLLYAKDRGMNILELDISKILAFPEIEYNSSLEKSLSILKQKQNLIITSCLTKESLKKVMLYAEKNHITKEEIAKYIKDIFGKMVKSILKEVEVSGIFLTGGDTAISIIKNLEVEELEILLELSVGTVLLKITEGKYKGLPIITKAGSFGDEKILYESMIKIKEGIL
ncbi:four-carbon acid sugar kinase family protein [Fusobacterium simiae]|uniref:four-carbon acid sugar kinase family protein n=1 Tax=Fusobacterium simiae TaxID=855 RepID=UPI0020C52091|nr:four-carbon acid sugar kinase family protein [Fusobacterium simiae]MDC7955770.1 four-carbon acid sugar kinase family protein [Fusobacterium simiae]